MTANHKTGSFLGMCLTRILEDYGIQARVASIHCSGGFSEHSLQINMVRDPFALVDSGYLYHARRGEKWSRIPFESLEPGYWAWRHGRILTASSTSLSGRIDENCQAAFAAYLSFKELVDREACSELSVDKSAIIIRPDESYGEAVSRLPLRYGLLLEGLRALYRDVPYVVASSQDCSKTATCSSVLLDDIKRLGYGRAFDTLLSKPLHLAKDQSDKIRYDFVKHCDPSAVLSESSTSSSTTQHKESGGSGGTKDACAGKVHITSLCGGRSERIATLKEIDISFLGGALTRANETINFLASKAPK